MLHARLRERAGGFSCVSIFGGGTKRHISLQICHNREYLSI